MDHVLGARTTITRAISHVASHQMYDAVNEKENRKLSMKIRIEKEQLS